MSTNNINLHDLLAISNKPPQYRASVILPEATLERMRALRLWHWLEIMELRERIRRSRSPVEAELLDHYTGPHMTAVQSLNEFFDVGDTAEADAAKKKD